MHALSDDVEERSRQIRARREKAERELEEARRRQRTGSYSAHSINSLDSEEIFSDQEHGGSPSNQNNKSVIFSFKGSVLF